MMTALLTTVTAHLTASGSGLAVTLPKISGRLAEILSGAVGLVIVLVALAGVLVVGWAWETEQPWFGRRVARLSRYVVVPLLVALAGITTIVRLLALS
jgi:hypothetical protein